LNHPYKVFILMFKALSNTIKSMMKKMKPKDKHCLNLKYTTFKTI